MKTSSVIFLVVFTTLIFAFTPIENATWKMDTNHAKVGFTVTHMMISDVDGYFGKVTASVTTTGDDFSNAMAEMTADVTTISTDNDRRDNDLKGPIILMLQSFRISLSKALHSQKQRLQTLTWLRVI